MKKALDPIRLLAEILAIVVAAQAVAMLALPTLASGASPLAQALLSAALLALLAGPTVYWRCMAAPQRSMPASARRRATSSSIGSAIALTAAAQLLGLAMTAVGVWWQQHSIEAEARGEFDRGAERIEAEVVRRFAQPLYGLRGIRGIHAAGAVLDRAALREYVDASDLTKEFPGVRGFGFIQRVPREDLARFVAAEQVVGMPEFAVKTSGDAADLFVVKQIEPISPNFGDRGIDIGQEAVRREAAERAVGTGEPTLSGRITLAQGERRDPGFLYLLSVYRRGTDAATPRQRSAQLLGLLYTPIAAAEIMHGVADVTDRLLDFELFDGSTAQATALIFGSNAQPQDAGQRMFESSRPLAVGGRTLVLRVGTTAAFDATIDRSILVAIGLGGVLASFMMALAVWLLAVGRVRAQIQAQRMTADLDRLARVAQHTSNAVFITDAELRINWVNEGFTRTMGYTLADVAGRKPSELLASAMTDPATMRTLHAATEAGQACRVEVLKRAKDGSDYWIDAELQPTHDAHGVLTGFMEIGTDITAQKHTRLQLESALRETEALLRTVHRHAIVSVADRAGRIVEVNDAFCAISGYSRAELLGQDHRIVNSGVQSAAFWVEMWRSIASGTPWRGEICNRSKDGSLYWVDSMIAPFEGADGKVEKYFSIRTDITRRKLDEHALRASMAFLDRAGRIAGVGGWQIDLGSGDITWSDETCRIHEMPLGHRPSMEEGIAYYAPAARPVIERAVRDGREHGKAWDLELPLITASGRAIWVRSAGEAELANGIAVRLVGAFQDITERRATDEKLRRSNEMMTGVIENLPCGLSVCDGELQVVAHNTQFRQMLEMPDSLFALPQTTFEQVIRFNAERGEYGPGDIEAIVAPILQRARHPTPHMFIRQRPSGVTMEVRGSPMPGGGFVTTYTDISERKRAEVQLNDALACAEQASVAKSQFLANMSHEIRTPMNAILGMLKLLQNTPLSARQLDYASKTEGAARSLLGLLNDILDFSKVEAGKMTLDPRPFRIDRLLRDLSVILSANVGAKDIEVLYDIDPAVPQGLLGDDMRLQQVLINLGSNAIKFTSVGQVVLRLRVLERGEHDVLLEFALRDSGIGIAPENQAHIFSGFSQAEASTTRRFGGTGLGLAISQRLVALLGGELRLDSVLGLGSTFSFELRLALADVAADDAQPASGPELGLLRTLIVDDNAHAREVMASTVQSLGWQADVAASGAEAIALVEARSAAGGSYQVVFVDWQMPGLDGWQTSQRIRQLPGVAEASLVVMVTAHGREMLAQRSTGEQSLLNGFLVKPVTASMIFDAVVDARVGLAHPQLLNRPASARTRPLAGLRLLVVEDNLNNQQVALELLEDEGAHVDLADNGLLGVAAVAAADPPFDAVLMDLQMPVMDGYTATARIRSELGLTALPIIAMTANAMASDREACLAAGMNDHVGKPFDLTSLVALLLRHTGRAAAPRAVDANAALDATALPAALLADATHRGIDLAAALARMGGNRAVYLRLLQSFVKELPSLPDRLAEHLAKVQDIEGGRLMHTTNGVAATLGLQALAGVAGDAEKCLGDFAGRASPGQREALTERLRIAVDTTLRDTRALAQALQDTMPKPEADVPTEAGDTAGVLDSLRELIALLRGADMRALEVFEQLQRSHPGHWKADLQPLDEAMAALDFEQALMQCQALTHRLTNGLTNALPEGLPEEPPA